MNKIKLAAIFCSCCGLMLVCYGIIDLHKNGRIGLLGLILVFLGAALTRKLLSGRRK